jgi:hypothetical protein
MDISKPLTSNIKISCDVSFTNHANMIGPVKLDAWGKVVRLTAPTMTLKGSTIKCEKLILASTVSKLSLSGVVTIECNELILESTIAGPSELALEKSGETVTRLVARVKSKTLNGRKFNYIGTDHFEIEW